MKDTETVTLDEILTKLENAVESSTLSRISGRQSVSDRTVHSNAKAAILALITSKQEALLDRLESKNTNLIAVMRSVEGTPYVEAIPPEAIQAERAKLKEGE